ncbi:CHAT domain-containing protein [Nostoc punctiforme FACHB-252]|uniref:CHAT domain-containing protein n=1 Tax=Nostoc punctiforme FACHB-252 TaxID=1357509 RepID=A0ABR8H593_NOSPU|nr:CHAT domain-containing protein [Nostoc punctiforme]MBD2610385.1 CHAT domain-containing protein [Nostoc punctiforme FACHB-252]
MYQKRSFILFASIVLVSQTVVTIVGQTEASFAQSSTTRSPQTSATAEKLYEEGIELYNQGTPKSLREAIFKLQEALQLWRDIGNKESEANTIHDIGRAYFGLGNKQQAINFYNQSLSLIRALNDKTSEAIILDDIGTTYLELGERQKAIEFYNQSLSINRNLGNKFEQAITLSHIASVYYHSEDMAKSLEYLQESLSLYRTISDRNGEAYILLIIGRTYDKFRQNQKALEFYNQSLSMYRTLKDKAWEATALRNIGGIYNKLEEKQKALEYYNQALSLRRKIGQTAKVVNTLNLIGIIYDELGQQQKALEIYKEALSLSRSIGDAEAEGNTLSNMALVYDNLDDELTAIGLYEEALSLRRATGDKYGEAVTLNNMGKAHWVLRNTQRALELYNQALDLMRQLGSKEGESSVLGNIGTLYSSVGEKETSLELFHQSLSQNREIGDKEGEAVALFNIASVERKKGNLEASVDSIKSAIAIIENLRSKVINEELRASYFGSKQNYYEFYIDLLMELHEKQPNKGYNAQALHASERARARSLIELLTEAGANIRQGVDAQLSQRQQNLEKELNTTEFRKYQLLQGQYTKKELAQIKQQIATLLNQLEEVKTQIRLKSPRYAALTQPQPLTLKEIQNEVLDEKTILLEYSLGKKHSYLWAVTKTDISSYKLGDRETIEETAQAYYKQVTSSQEVNPKIGKRLSQMLLSPVASKLKGKRLLIVGDGVLQSIPFAALPTPETSVSSLPKNAKENFTPLLVQNEIVLLPSASTIAIQRRELKNRPPAPKTVAILADPVFNRDDRRLQATNNHTAAAATTSEVVRSARDIGVVLDRLKYSRQEADAITKLVSNTSQRLSSLDFEASRTTATNPNLAQYQMVHFATHGLINTVNPELSGIVLSLVNQKGEDTDGFLRLHDIFNLNLPVELVTLSACETGLGKDLKGEGLVGLTRGFMYAGAKRVAVSLWSVNDTATASLMTKFYQQILQKGLTPIAALRAAQLEMWQTQQWNAPYYWAAFVVQGEWR